MKDKEVIIMRNSDEAAQVKTVTGWVSRSGRFFGSDERMARYDGCTHDLCECGKIMEKTWAKCEWCRDESSKRSYESLPFKEWDKQTPLYCQIADKYFFDEDDILYYLEDNDMQDSSGMRLVFCSEEYLSEVNPEHWTDELPEDGELPHEVEEAVKKLNEVIRKQGPVSYWPGKTRTSVDIKVSEE